MIRFIGLIALPLTLAGIAFVLLVALRALLAGAVPRARRLALGATIALLAYIAVLLGVSLASHERVLQPGAEKFLCDLDCDLALSVPRLMPARPSARGARAFYVTLRVRSDAKRAVMRLGPVRVWIVSADGHRFVPVGGSVVPFNEPLPPGARMDVSLRFEIPGDARDLKLAIADGGMLSWFVIGDENSFLHRRTLFALPEALAAR